MTDNRWDSIINDLLDTQVEIAALGGFIFTVSLSESQVRVFITTHGQQEQQFFLYKHADDKMADRVVTRINNFVTSMKTWLNLHN